MDLTTAINLVIVDSREADPDSGNTDTEIVSEVRGFDNEEIDAWVETDVIEAGSEIETAYRAVIAATDDEIAEHRTGTRVQTDGDADTDCL